MSKKFASRLKSERLAASYSQAELANELGLTSAAISAYERNLREPDLDTLCKIADFLGTSTDYLLGRSELPNTADSIDRAKKAQMYKMLDTIKRHMELIDGFLIEFQKMNHIVLPPEEPKDD